MNRQVTADSYTYNTLLSAFERGAQPQMALHFLRPVSRAVQQADQISQRIMLLFFCVSGQTSLLTNQTPLDWTSLDPRHLP